MEILNLKGNDTPNEGYYVSDRKYLDAFKSQELTPEHLIEIANEYKEAGFDAIGVWVEDDGIVCTDAFTYTETYESISCYYAYEIKTGKHITITTN